MLSIRKIFLLGSISPYLRRLGRCGRRRLQSRGRFRWYGRTRTGRARPEKRIKIEQDNLEKDDLKLIDKMQ